ncbi:MAG: Flp pilus assembly protein TadG [Paracoccaceae bacterium]|jgi:Flp pilus assembly protein TadG
MMMYRTPEETPARWPMAVLRDDRGGMGLFMLIWVVGIVGLGGFAVDTSKAWRMKAMLQATADAASHAGALAIDAGGDATAAASRYVELNMPAAKLGEVLRLSDIEVGAWNRETHAFEVGANSPDAVRVTLYRAKRNNNAEPLTLLKMLGLPDWDLAVSSVSGATQTYGVVDEVPDSCLTRGLVARGVVGVTSNNVFDDVCVHGEQGFTMNNNNLYTGDTIISMPNISALLNLGKAVNYANNLGLETALREMSLDPSAVDHVVEMVVSYAKNATLTAIEDYSAAALNDGDNIYVHCSAPGTLTLPSRRLVGVTVTTNCDIKFSNNAQFVSSIIGTTGDAGQIGLMDGLVERVLGIQASATPSLMDRLGLVAHADTSGSATVMGASDVSFGEPDDCADGGGSLLLVQGDFHLAAKMGLFGSTVIASGNIDLAAQTLGVEGPSIMAGGDVDMPAQQTFRGCNGADFRIGLRNVYHYLK